MNGELNRFLEILSSIQQRLENKPNKDPKELELLSYVKKKKIEGESLNETR